MSFIPDFRPDFRRSDPGPGSRRGRWPAWMVVALVVAVSGCGFQPLHQRGSAGSPEVLAAIEIANIADRRGQKLRNFLLDRLSPHGPPRYPVYVLDVALSESKGGLGVRKDAFATRAFLTVNASFSLFRAGLIEQGTFTGGARSTNYYNIVKSEFATLAAEENARNRALRAIADEIRVRIAAALRTPNPFRIPEETPEKPDENNGKKN